LEATYRVTTPLFLGGADMGKTAELRPPSLKGLLRFWFRAVALPRLGTFPRVWEAERSLFGSTEKQANFLLSVVARHATPARKPWRSRGAAYGMAYLGYGVVDSRGRPVRPYLEPGGRFTVRLLLKKGIEKQEITFLEQSLKALGLFGGAGARSRKGFGSLSIESLCLDGREIWNRPANADELRQVIRNFLTDGIHINQASDRKPPYTAFGSDTKVYIIKTDGDALTLLDEIGKELLRYRSYGRQTGGKHVLSWGELAEQNFAGDHDVIWDYLNGGPITRHPRRVVFGLPHNYFFQSSKQRATVEAVNLKRRASPLFIHIHALANGQYVAVLVLVPAVFLPSAEEIKVTGGKRSVEVFCNVDFGIIEEFLNRPAFQQRVVVWP
jgi:CRISPR-associated protein Cmr1